METSNNINKIPPPTDSFERLESNVRSYARSFPQTFNRALGAELWDNGGRRYLDFLAGAGALNYGHNNPVFKTALIKYIESDGIAHSLDLQTVAKENFLNAMNDIILAPRGFDHVMQFTGPTGTNAVEAALKIARKVTGRSNIISFTNGFHGVSLGALAMTGNEHLRGAAGVSLPGSTRMPFDGYLGDNFDTISYMERLLDDPSSGIDPPAAAIVECVQGEGGLNVARDEWLKRLRQLCDKHGIILIADDIQAGCGRCGSFFSFESSEIIPDIVTLSKSLSGFGLPLSVVLIKRDLDKWLPGEHNGTFRGNNHAFITATAALETYWQTPEFEAAATAKGDQLRKGLQKIADRFAPAVLGLRGKGLFRGLVFTNPDHAGAVTKKALDLGLMIERCGPRDEVVKCMAPITIASAELDEGLDILNRACQDVLQ